VEKTCRTCKQVLPTSLFHRNRRSPDGLNCECKTCRSIYGRAYREQNREAVLARKRDYRTKNNEKVKAGQRSHYVRNREAIREKRRRMRVEKKEQISAWRRARYLKHREAILEQCRGSRNRRLDKVRAYNRSYYLLHRKECREQSRKYYIKNSDKVKARVATYRLANYDKARATSDRVQARRRARMTGGTFENIDRNLVFKRDGGRCHLCGKRVEKAWHLDHIIPIALGGAHEYRNVAVACVHCNLSKNRKALGQLLLIG